jgi:hypothetical protein
MAHTADRFLLADDPGLQLLIELLGALTLESGVEEESVL